MGLGVMVLLGLVALRLMLLLGHGRHSGSAFMAFFMAAGFTVALALASLQRALRRDRRARLAIRLGPDDWVCARCLHARPGH